MEPSEDPNLDVLSFGLWAVPVEDALAESSSADPAPDPVPPPRLWPGPDESAGALFRPRHDDDALPPNGSFFRLRKRGDAA